MFTLTTSRVTAFLVRKESWFSPPRMIQALNEEVSGP